MKLVDAICVPNTILRRCVKYPRKLKWQQFIKFKKDTAKTKKKSICCVFAFHFFFNTLAGHLS